MPTLTDNLQRLLKKGAQLFLPDGASSLAYAWPGPDWAWLGLLTAEGQGLSERRYGLTASDYDESTGKLYAAYSDTDYLQIRPLPFDKIKPHRRTLEQAYLELTRKQLPEIAEAAGWPVQEDHCIQRMVLDAIYQDCWYNHLAKGRRPAYQQLSNIQLGQALLLAHRLRHASPKLLEWLNACSLSFRKKTPID